MLNFRLILNFNYPTAFNMAVDEMLLEAQARGDAPTLRFYTWERPALSIGYFQKVDDFKRGPAGEGREIVRRITGGGMVPHGDDLTVSLVLRNPGPFLPREPKASYLKIHEAMMAGLRDVHPAIDFADCKAVPSGRAAAARECFRRPVCHDLMLNGRKIAGGSQRRLGGALLHQTSVQLEADKGLLAGKVVDGFRRKWGIVFEERELSDAETVRAGEIERARYSSADWGFFLERSLAW